jgi:hypothetical protein
MKKNISQPSITALAIILFFGFLIGATVGYHFISNKSELLDAMSSTSKVRLENDTERLNKLIEDLRKTESKASNNSVSNRQEMSKLYLSLAGILADDLHNIQLNNPRIAANTRVTIDALRGLSTDIMKENIYPESFRPQNIR